MRSVNPFRRTNLTVVRRYIDMNGRHVGELYLDGRMIGASLDNLPLDQAPTHLFWLDTRRSFLKPMGYRTVRVGGMAPEEDRFTRMLVRSLPSLNMMATFHNRFVSDMKQCGKPPKGMTR